jgi:hypothetical protein
MPLCLLKFALSELFAQVSQSGKMTLADRYGLLAAILDDTITEEERRSLDRLLRSINRGRIQVVDEISMIPNPRLAAYRKSSQTQTPAPVEVEQVAHR